MRILIANRRLSGYTGTEVVTRDLALALHRLGHEPCVYSPWLGGPAEELLAAGVPVHSDLAFVSRAPDVIHGNHPKPLLDALFRFPGVPAVTVCHDATSRADEPVAHPRIFRYAAVDARCLARVEGTREIPRSLITVRYNAVDLARFRRRPPLGEHPARALVFSNYASRRTHLPAVERACQRASLSLGVVGANAGRAETRPEEILGEFDVVFAKARCALEALATGAAVVLCDAAGLGPMVTSANVEDLRRMNFGRGVLTRRVTADALLAELAHYDPADASRVCSWIRAEAGLEQSAREWVCLYEEIAADARRHTADAKEERAAADRLRTRWRRENRRERVESAWRRLARVPVLGPSLRSLARSAASFAR